ncbi:hypothetical protein ES705_47384 [subsurface metagenome]
MSLFLATSTRTLRLSYKRSNFFSLLIELVFTLPSPSNISDNNIIRSHFNLFAISIEVLISWTTFSLLSKLKDDTLFPLKFETFKPLFIISSKSLSRQSQNSINLNPACFIFSSFSFKLSLGYTESIHNENCISLPLYN